MSEPTRDDDAWLVALGAIVSDGGAVDWNDAEGRASTSEQRRLVGELRRVASVIKAHSSGPEPLIPAGPSDAASGYWRHLLLFERIGGGNFGDVHRAWDPQLDRDVAVKLIARTAGHSDSPLAEARHLARVRHPHVVTVYGADEDDDQAGIWMEYIRGQTLAGLVRDHGPMSARETVGIGLDLCAALSAIHGAGLLHRDIKADNVMRETGGRIVLMDFSGAQAVTPGTASSVLTGTPLYMAPELFAGAPPSPVTDVYSMGVLLFYLLTATVPVDGLSAADLKEAHARGDRKRLRDERADIPEAVMQVIERATALDPVRRFRSAGELEEALAYTIAIPGHERAAAAPRRWWQSPIWVPVAAACAALAAFAAWSRPAPAPAPSLIRFKIGPPLLTGSWPRLSPDGRYVVFGTPVTGRDRLWIQPLDNVEGHPLLETSAGETPFWSPDSRMVCFFEGGKLKRVSVDGGDPQVLADAPVPHGGDWSGRTILYTRGDGIYRLDAGGGAAVRVASVDEAQGDYQLGWPEFLPDGHRFLYVLRSDTSERTGLYLADLADGSSRRILPAYSRTAYAAGHIFYVRNGALTTQAFDPDTAVADEHATVLVPRVQAHVTNDAAFDVTASGRLIYFSPPGLLQTRLVLVDRAGNEIREIAGPAAHSRPRFAPDGQRIVAEKIDPGESSADLWVYGNAETGAVRLTLDAANDVNPVWSSDSRRIAFSSKRGTSYDIYVKVVDAVGEARLLRSGPGDKMVEDWSDDERFLVGSVLRSGLWALPLDPDDPPELIRGTSTANRWSAAFSADHRWVAYNSEEYGDRQVYIEPFPSTGDRWQVSAHGGGEPHWRADGRELYYLDPAGNLMAVTQTGPDWRHPRTVKLFAAPIQRPTEGNNFSPAPDGQSFVLNAFVAEGVVPPIEVVINWPLLLDR